MASLLAVEARLGAQTQGPRVPSPPHRVGSSCVSQAGAMMALEDAELLLAAQALPSAVVGRHAPSEEGTLGREAETTSLDATAAASRVRSGCGAGAPGQTKCVACLAVRGVHGSSVASLSAVENRSSSREGGVTGGAGGVDGRRAGTIGVMGRAEPPGRRSAAENGRFCDRATESC